MIWNADISKKLKTVTLRFTISDILDQRKSLSRVAAAEYIRDTRNNVMGRCALIGISFNLGK